MATTPAAGTGPLEFTDADGHQVSIPLSAVTFDDKGVATVASAWSATLKPDVQKLVTTLLKHVTGERLIVPAAAPAQKAAMVVKAADPGPAGNAIKVAFTVTPNADPTQAKFTITVEEKQQYDGLTAATVEAMLGTDQAAGTKPGPVVVKSGTVKPNLIPANTTTASTLRVGTAGTPAKADVMDASTTPQAVFTVQARKTGADGELTTVTISNADTQTKKFTLTAAWKKIVQDVTLAKLSQAASDLAYEVTITPPESGVVSVPADTKTTPIALSGGATGATASAVVFATP